MEPSCSDGSSPAEPKNIPSQARQPDAGPSKRQRNASPSTSSEKRPKKLRRVFQACNRCRQRKEKCNGGEPACSSCISARQPCSYKGSTRPRGLRTGYVRVHEMMWGAVISVIPGSEEVLRTLLKSIVAQDADEWRLSTLETWKNSRLLADFESIVPKLGVPDSRTLTNRGATNIQALAVVEAQRKLLSESIQTHWSLKGASNPVGPSPDEGGSFRSTRNPPTSLEDESYSMGYSPDTAIGVLPPMETSGISIQAQYMTENARERVGEKAETECAGDTLPALPPETWALLDLYFAYTHPWFPIVDRSKIFKTAYLYSKASQETTHTSHRSESPAALWAILAYSACQNCAMEYDGNSATAEMNKRMDKADIYRIARRFIPIEDAKHEVDHIQALLLLGLIKTGSQSFSSAWMLIGQAVRMALDLGLDRPGKTDRSGACLESEETKRRVFSGCFIIDSFVSAHLGRSCHLRTTTLQNIGKVEETGIEEWGPWTRPGTVKCQSSHTCRTPAHSGSTFNQLVALAGILNDAVADGGHQIISLEAYLHTCRQLQEWNDMLPNHYKIADPPINPVRMQNHPPPNFLVLQVMHATTQMTLESRFMAERGTRTSSLSFKGNTSAEHSKRILNLMLAYSSLFTIESTPAIFEIAVSEALACREGFAATPQSNGLPNITASLAGLQNLQSRMSMLWGESERIPDQLHSETEPGARPDMVIVDAWRTAQPAPIHEEIHIQNGHGHTVESAPPAAMPSVDPFRTLSQIAPAIIEHRFSNPLIPRNDSLIPRDNPLIPTVNALIPPTDTLIPPSNAGPPLVFPEDLTASLPFPHVSEYGDVFDEIAALDSFVPTDHESRFYRNLGYG